MQATTFTKKGGKITFIGNTLGFLLSMLRNGTYTVTIKQKRERRSANQNALMWMWFTCIADHTGNTPQEVHDAYCNMFLSRQYLFNGKYVTTAGGTSELDTSQFADFLNKVQADAQTELGISLPSPDDLYYEEFYQTYKDRA